MGTPLRLAAARFRASSDRPYLAPALWALIPIASPGLNTLAVDKYWRMYYDPNVVEEWDRESLSGVIIHEVGHLLRDHSARAEDMGAAHDYGCSMKWNIAADCEINDDLVTEKIKLPQWRDKSGKIIGNCVIPSTYQMPDNKMVEEYYNLLDEKIEIIYVDVEIDKDGRVIFPGDDGGDSKPGDDRGSSPKSSSDKSKPSSPGKQQIIIYRVKDKRIPKPGSGHCGSAASGHQEPWELGDPNGTNPGIGKSEGKNIRDEVARQILESSKTRGDIPAGWQRWAEELLTPKVDWRKEIKTSIRGSIGETMGAVDYSRKRPSRRQSAYGDVIMPSLRKPLPRIGVLLDTSGSMSDKKVGQSIAEVSGLLRSMGMTGITVASCDAMSSEAKKCFSVRDIIPLGGGGTDMRVGISMFHELKPRINTLIVLTDCETPWPDHAPEGMDIIIGKIGTGQTPDWAKVVVIDEE